MGSETAEIECIRDTARMHSIVWWAAAVADMDGRVVAGTAALKQTNRDGCFKANKPNLVCGVA